MEEKQLLAIDGPEITAMLVSVQKTSDSGLGVQARAVDIILMNGLLGSV